MSSVFRPGDVIKLESVVYLYELIDDYGIVFYVGISRDPNYRFRSHANPNHCDSEAVCAEIALCKSPTMRIVSVHPTREEALHAESARVRETPGVLNSVARHHGPRPPRKRRQRSPEYYQRKRERRARRDASKVLESASIGGVMPAPFGHPVSPLGAV